MLDTVVAKLNKSIHLFMQITHELPCKQACKASAMLLGKASSWAHAELQPVTSGNELKQGTHTKDSNPRPMGRDHAQWSRELSAYGYI
jgi:hypothetical protein